MANLAWRKSEVGQGARLTHLVESVPGATTRGHARGARLARAGLAVVGLVASLMAVGVQAAAAADTSAPTEPGTITTSSVTASSVALKWGSSTDNVGIEGYRVYRGPSASALSLIATTDAVTSYSATRLYSGASYTFGVTAIDAANNESLMRTVTITTLTSSDTTAPVAPSSTSVAFRVFSSSRIDVVWGTSSSSDVAGYRVYRNGAQVGSVDLPNGLRLSDNGLTAATSYSYVIKAIDSAGNLSAGTTSKSATTLASGAVIIARGPYLSNVTGSSAVISWWTNLATSGSVAINGQTFPDSSQQHHQVLVTGLSPGTSYPYTVSSGGVSASGTVRTAATAGQTYSFAAIGDFGGNSSGESQNAANIAGAGTQFIQTLGDNIYPTSGLPDPNFTTTYSDFDQRFFKQFSSAVKSQSFFPANGNKEYYGNGEFWSAFPMPGSNHSWYSYDWGDAHILVLDSEQPYTPGTEQYNFAQADLAANQSAAWRIVAIQRPPYSSTTNNSSSKGVQTYLVPLFQAQNVNLVLSGNSHNYERSKPLTNGVPATGGITYVVSGAGGNGFNAFNDTTYPQPAWSAFRESSYYEYSKVTVSPTALTVAAVRADTNAVFDSTTISKPGADTSPPTAPTLSAGTPTSNTVPLSWTASTDNVAVTGYKVYRNGGTTAVGTATGTSFTDTGLSANTQYSYTVTAVDAAGNESGPSNSVAVTTAAATGTTVTLTPTDDSTIDPATNTPSTSRLRVDASTPTNDMLLKFTAPSSCTSIAAATLQLTVGNGTSDPSTHGGDFYSTSQTDPNAGWAQSSVTWTSAPAKTGTAVTLGTAVAASTTYTLDVSRLVPSSGGTFTIRGTSTSGDGAGYYSTEGAGTTTANAPHLIVSCS